MAAHNASRVDTTHRPKILAGFGHLSRGLTQAVRFNWINWGNVKLIFLREVRDQLRDRRTLFMILILPLLLYPALGIGLFQMTAIFAQQPRRVAIVGADHLPDSPRLIAGNHFAANWFPNAKEAEQLELVFGKLDRKAVERGEIQVAIVFPKETRERLAAGETVTPIVVRNTADEKSLFTYGRVMEVLTAWQAEINEQRRLARHLPEHFFDPVQPKTEDVAEAEQRSANLWAKLFPFLLVIMSLTGAFYPAVDLCAGEKERGTMETLLISPASRGEIVLGKYFTIMLFSIATALLNLLSMGITGWQMASLMGNAAAGLTGEEAILAAPSLQSAVWIIVLLIPLSAFFSALCLALAAFARSSKEGQYYLMPLYLITMPLTILTIAPGVELTPLYAIVPVTGVALLLKALILKQYAVAQVYFLPVLVPTVLYSFLALRWAIDLFKREEVLFREAERLDFGLWMRHLIRDKQPTPSGGEAVFCFVVMLLVYWFSLPLITPKITNGFAPSDTFRILVVTQLAFVAPAPLLMTIILTSSPRRTLLLKLPPPIMVPAAFLLAAACHPFVLYLHHWMQQLLPMRKELVEGLRQLLSNELSLGSQLFLIAVLPAVFEELAFRGFILQGLLRNHKVGSAILISSFLFGLFHLNLLQMVTSVLLGCVIALLAVRSGSLLPGSLFHFSNNALTILIGRLTAEHIETSAWMRALFTADPTGGVVYRLPVMLVGLVIAGTLTVWLARDPRRHAADETSENTTPEETLVGSGV